MEPIQKVDTTNAPAAVGPYSQAVSWNGMLFCSGQIGLNPVNGELVSDDVVDQARQVFENLKAVLSASGTDFTRVLRVEVFLTDLSVFSEINSLYSEYFINDPKPARQTVEVSRLPKNAKVEVSVIAALQ